MRHRSVVRQPPVAIFSFWKKNKSDTGLSSLYEKCDIGLSSDNHPSPHSFKSKWSHSIILKNVLETRHCNFQLENEKAPRSKCVITRRSPWLYTAPAAARCGFHCCMHSVQWGSEAAFLQSGFILFSTGLWPLESTSADCCWTSRFLKKVLLRTRKSPDASFSEEESCFLVFFFFYIQRKIFQ